jgi:glutamate dehydrogenase (NADP+)
MYTLIGTHQALSPSAISFAKKRNVLHGPYRATQIGATMVNGLTLDTQPFLAGETLDSRIESTVSDLYEEIKDCAKEFNTRGDLNAGANITAFLRVADAMIAHGSV